MKKLDSLAVKDDFHVGITLVFMKSRKATAHLQVRHKGFGYLLMIVKKISHSVHFEFFTPVCCERNLLQWARECQRQRVFERFHRVSGVCFIFCLMMTCLSCHV